MSVYSDQINVVLHTRLIPQMQAVSLEIARIEPYSYSSTELEEYKRRLDYLSMLYDFLKEYADGNEELDNGKLVNIVRLLDAPTRERKSVDYLGQSLVNFTKVKTGYKVYLNSQEVNANSVITPGTAVSITVIYSTTEVITGTETIVLTTDGLSQTSDGFTIILQNKLIPLSSAGGNLTLTFLAKVDGIGVGGLQTLVIPIATAIQPLYYYGVGAAGLNVAQIQGLTQLLEAKSNKSLDFTADDQYFYFAYPAMFGLLSSVLDFTLNELLQDFTQTQRTFTINALPVSYYVYEFNNQVTVNNFELTFIY